MNGMKYLLALMICLCQLHDVSAVTDEEFQEMKVQNQLLQNEITELRAKNERFEERFAAVEIHLRQDMAAVTTEMNIIQESVAKLQDQMIAFNEEPVAFHALLTSCVPLTLGDVIVFNYVLLNVGDGYDGTTGVFTVPSGGDGLYYFSTIALVERTEYAKIDIQLNGINILAAGYADNDSGDHNEAVTTAAVNLVEGDTIYVRYHLGYDDSPFSCNYPSTLFNGFKI